MFNRPTHSRRDRIKNKLKKLRGNVQGAGSSRVFATQTAGRVVSVAAAALSRSSLYAPGSIQVIKFFSESGEIKCDYTPDSPKAYGRVHAFSLVRNDGGLYKKIAALVEDEVKLTLKVDQGGVVYRLSDNGNRRWILGQLNRKKDLSAKVLRRTILAPVHPSKKRLGLQNRDHLWLSSAFLNGRPILQEDTIRPSPR